MKVYHIWSCAPASSDKGVHRAACQRPRSSGPGSSGRGCGHLWRIGPDSVCSHQTWCSLRDRWSTPEHYLLSRIVGWVVCTTDLLRWHDDTHQIKITCCYLWNHPNKCWLIDWAVCIIQASKVRHTMTELLAAFFCLVVKHWLLGKWLS